ncbi:unnamed protein product [Plutella xylostella]|uniref:(diamondback moth) hypothetical protein n=1 Tax=Plutella xylostella TaxID=51655 RepID=A0A8S4DN67_PLUXY|nr:unnamed protein product [Plutella xylostella]
MAQGNMNGHQIQEELPLGIKVEEIEIPVRGASWRAVVGAARQAANHRVATAGRTTRARGTTWCRCCRSPRPCCASTCPGHGLSSHYPTGMHYYIFWDGVSLLRRIVKHFGWSKVTLMGHSLGGALSFMYAASFPDDVGSHYLRGHREPGGARADAHGQLHRLGRRQVPRIRKLDEDRYPATSTMR